MTTAEKIVYATDNTLDEAQVPLNDSPVILQDKNKTTCWTYKVKLACAFAFVVALCVGGGCYYYFTKVDTKLSYTVRYIKRT
jgi:hypothetical protein